MKNKGPYTVQPRRKREGKTHYRKRIRFLIGGRPRLVIRRSLANMTAQIITYNEKGDIVNASAHSSELKKYGWRGYTGNIPSAYLTGLLLGQKAKKAGIKGAILDIGLNKSIKGTRLYAALAGAVDAGLDIPFGEGILPPKERLSGEHIASYYKAVQKDGKSTTFSNYLKNNVNPEDIPRDFENTKKKITGAKE